MAFYYLLVISHDIFGEKTQKRLSGKKKSTHYNVLSFLLEKSVSLYQPLPEQQAYIS